MARRLSSASGRAGACAPLLAAVVAAWTSGGGCANPQKMFQGNWQEVRAAEAAAEQRAEGGALPGSPMLLLGHYGNEVAGVVQFRRASDGACSCAYVDGLNSFVNLSDRSLEFTTGRDEPDCPRLTWELDLQPRGDDERPRLEGRVGPAGRAGGGEPILLEREKPTLTGGPRTCGGDG